MKGCEPDTDNVVSKPQLNIEILSKSSSRWTTMIEDVESIKKARGIMKARRQIYQERLRLVLVVKSIFPEES